MKIFDDVRHLVQESVPDKSVYIEIAVIVGLLSRGKTSLKELNAKKEEIKRFAEEWVNDNS